MPSSACARLISLLRKERSALQKDKEWNKPQQVISSHYSSAAVFRSGTLFTTLSSSPSSAPHQPQQEPSRPTSSQQPALPREVQPHAPLSSSPPRAFPPPGASSSRLEYEFLVRLRGRVIQRPLVRFYDCGDLDGVPGIFYCRWLDKDQ